MMAVHVGPELRGVSSVEITVLTSGGLFICKNNKTGTVRGLLNIHQIQKFNNVFSFIGLSTVLLPGKTILSDYIGNKIIRKTH